MTSLLERTISIIAPHYCFACSKESNILCEACALQVFGDLLEICVLCNKPTASLSLCRGCASQTALRHVWVASEYDGVVKRLIHAYKFERLRAAYRPLTQGMLDVLPYLDADTVVVHIPTATNRIRQRGYDQSKLLAVEIAHQRAWRYAPLLRRTHQLRQVGSSKVTRLAQAQQAFQLVGGDVRGLSVLLVDDVTTSGATLVAAAQILLAAGARQVDAVVVAKQMLEKS